MYGSPVFKLYNNQTVETKRNDAFLKEVAGKTHGNYLVNPNNINDVLEQNLFMNALSIFGTNQFPYVFMALVLLLAAMYVPEKRKLEK